MFKLNGENVEHETIEKVCVRTCVYFSCIRDYHSDTLILST